MRPHKAADLQSISGMRQIERHVWRRVRMGFFALIPLLATYIALRFLIGYIDGLLAPLLNILPFSFPGLGLLLFVVSLYLLGLAVSAKIGKAIIAAQHAVFSRMPVIKTIYRVTKQASDNLSSYAAGHDFKRVVLVEWPKRNVYALGFVTGQCVLQGGDERLTIYIPTVPNPTSGMFALMSINEVVETDISVEEAIKIVLSGGIVLPNKLNGIALPQRDWAEQYAFDDFDDDYLYAQPAVKLDPRQMRLKIPLAF